MTYSEQDILQTLKALGYDNREITVYLALLQLGEASAQAIAVAAKVERTGVYDVLRRLKNGGLVAEILRSSGRHYAAEPPRRIEERLTTQLSRVHAILPTLESRYAHHATKPTIRFYEGTDGIKTVLQETLSAPNRDLIGILSMVDLFGVIGEEAMDRYVRRRIDNDIQLRVIRSHQKDVDERWPTNPKALRELRYAPDGMVFSMTTYVYGNNVALLSTRKENFGMIIESDEFATQQRHLFESLWQISQPVPEL